MIAISQIISLKNMSNLYSKSNSKFNFFDSSYELNLEVNKQVLQPLINIPFRRLTTSGPKILTKHQSDVRLLETNFASKHSQKCKRNQISEI